ncbi:MAG: hypothetical protein KIG60_06795 [Caryophanon sp.]|nr:hypothetical protein [Caryophanon sp.]
MLRNPYTVTVVDEKLLTFSVNEKVEQYKMKPAGQLIADSDQFAFVYLCDAGDAYAYIRFEPAVWPALVEVLIQEQDPTVQIGEETMTLPHFFEELQMLVYNIEGNGNYGDAFVSAVEQAFERILVDAK